MRVHLSNGTDVLVDSATFQAAAQAIEMQVFSITETAPEPKEEEAKGESKE